MSRLFAYAGNDADRVRCALYSARSLLLADAAQTQPPVTFDSWGIGFYQGGEILLQRRPKAPTEPVDFYAITRDLRSDMIIGHVRAGTVGTPKNENTHPFRFRGWLFAHHGTIPHFERVREDLMATVPDFLRRNIRGQTDSEHLFHLVLAFLHEAGKLDDPLLSNNLLADAARAALARVDQVVGPEARTATCALALTNGTQLLVTRRGQPVYVQRVQGIRDCAVCRESTPQFGREPRRIDHEHLRAVTIIADPPPGPVTGWEEVPDGGLVHVAADLSVVVSPPAR